MATTTSDQVVGSAAIFYIAKRVISGLIKAPGVDETQIDTIITNKIIKCANAKSEGK